MKNLNGKIALVTGATRGVGKGVALELAEAGAIVYVTGRTVSEETFGANERAIPIYCDHTHDSEVEAVFRQISKEQDRLDILVNNVWGGYENMIENGEFTWTLPFWKQPLWRWDAMFAAGVRAHYVASAHAARTMVAQQSGLIESPQFIGRAVVALASDSNIMQKSGQVLVAAALAQEYGFSDINEKQPRPLTLEQV